ncbi:hypothetical protein Tco_1243518 [Tanacetum coccineum]
MDIESSRTLMACTSSTPTQSVSSIRPSCNVKPSTKRGVVMRMSKKHVQVSSQDNLKFLAIVLLPLAVNFSRKKRLQIEDPSLRTIAVAPKPLDERQRAAQERETEFAKVVCNRLLRRREKEAGATVIVGGGMSCSAILQLSSSYSEFPHKL